MAATKKKGLGRGLGQIGGGINAMIPQNPDIKNKEKDKENVSRETLINIDTIEPNKEQPREYFDEEGIIELSKSIKQYGIIQPLLLKKNGKIYNIIAGERRWRAAKLAGLKEVPAIIKDYTEEQTLAVALIENIQREDLNPIEEARAYKKLIEEFSLTQEELSNKVSKSRASITNTLRLLKLDERVQEMLVEGQISSGHARSLISIKDKEVQYMLALDVINKQLSVRDVEFLVKDLKNKEEKDADKKNNDPKN
ncbi:MAG TPA: ParB/RepB/Spo0J family partition protein, partial [Clostridiales bacterium]|nr:ParB/RepB/Spo0J family partition protein [Clostridiales bacterium]